MMKVAIVTYHYVSNYGALLQAWGLQKFLVSQGHQASFIDYRPAHLTTGGGFWWPTSGWRCRANIVIALMKARSLKQAIFGNGQQRRFDEFCQTHLSIASPRYETLRELDRNPPQADAYICGSDQIWNASKQRGIDPVYFLPFGASDIRRVSFAASFGRPHVPPRFQAEVGELLGGLDAISVRERSGVDIVRDLAGRDAAWVPDPTLMVDDGYPEAIPPERDGDYIFSYTLRSRDLVSEIEQDLGQRLGLEVVSPATVRAAHGATPGPLEWLGYIKHSRFVITNSYHGTLFSIIFRRPFAFVGLPGNKAAFNERALSILELLGLSDRTILDYDPTQLGKLTSEPPNWEAVQIKLRPYRDSGINFVREALQ
jgi:hypothetical protein